MDGMFEKYVNMCRKVAWKFASANKMNYEDFEQEAFLIYCECLEKYDVTKSSFSTYLFINLNGRLKSFKEKDDREFSHIQEDEQVFANTEYFNIDVEPTIKELLESAKQILSDVAYTLIKYILSRNWEGGWYKNFNKKVAKKFLNVSEKELEPVWEECSFWWNNVAVSLFNF